MGSVSMDPNEERTDRIYSETLPWSELLAPRTLELLARYRLELVLAVRPWDAPALPDAARALRDAGVPLSIWPMLDDAEGRWASVHNAPEFDRFTSTLCDGLLAAGAPPRDVLFDLEPPFAQARALIAVATEADAERGTFRAALRSAHLRPAAYAAASATLARTVAGIHARGITTSIAVWPLVALDQPSSPTWQTILGTPVDALGAGHVSVMMYTSILEGWSRGTLRRADTAALLAAATFRAMQRWGSTAGMSLGCVGTGAFADEPVYRAPRDLAEDAAIARKAGCSRLSLFDLGGVLARAPAEGWLDAFVDDARGAGRAWPASKRVRVARTAARGATFAAELARRAIADFGGKV